LFCSSDTEEHNNEYLARLLDHFATGRNPDTGWNAVLLIVFLGVGIGPVLVADLPPFLLMHADSATSSVNSFELVVHVLVLPVLVLALVPVFVSLAVGTVLWFCFEWLHGI
jgi:uncharacterized membrane protein YdbT with pleckstrin-like domain